MHTIFVTDVSVPIVDFSYDLSTVAHVEDPNDFYAEYAKMLLYVLHEPACYLTDYLHSILREARERADAANALLPASPRAPSPTNAHRTPSNSTYVTSVSPVLISFFFCRVGACVRPPASGAAGKGAPAVSEKVSRREGGL